jgi:hypothetical protein
MTLSEAAEIGEQHSLSGIRMKNVCLAVVIGAFSMNLHGGVIACYDGVSGDPTTLRVGACATQVNFSTLAPNDSLDWSALGGNVNNTWDTTALGSWNAVTNGGITASLNRGSGFTGSPILERVDNGYLYDSGGGVWALAPGSMFKGHFNSVPSAGAGTPYGDNLVGFNAAQGPLLIQFSGGINSVGFYISTKNSLGVDATIKAYNGTTQVLSYRVTDTAGGGANCASLGNVPPVPCFDAPFLAIDAMSSQFTSIVISTTDTNGFYIDGLSIADAAGTPEPATGLMISGGFLLFGIGARRLRARR